MSTTQKTSPESGATRHKPKPAKKKKNVVCKKSMLSDEYKFYAVNDLLLHHPLLLHHNQKPTSRTEEAGMKQEDTGNGDVWPAKTTQIATSG